MSLEDALAEIDDIERKLHTAVENSPLREVFDYERVDAYLIETYRDRLGLEVIASVADVPGLAAVRAHCQRTVSRL